MVMAGRFLQIVKEELIPGQKRRGEQELLPPPQRVYDQEQPQPYYDHAPQQQHIGGALTPETLQTILHAAKLQGMVEERQRSQDRETEAHNRHADRMHQAHLAIIDKINSGGGQGGGAEGIGAYWKYLRRKAELAIWWACVCLVALLVGAIIAWLADNGSQYHSYAPAVSSQHKHWKRTEEYDDR
jgi:hypothetical protein